MAKYINSVEQMRVLLFLFARRPRAQHIEAIVGELRSNRFSIQKRLDDLSARGFVAAGESVDLYRFAEVPDEIGRLVAGLEKINVSHPYGVIEAIFDRPQASVQSIANAFDFRRPK